MGLDRAHILKYYEELTQFKKEDKEWLDERIHSRKDGQLGVECVVRGKNSDDDYFELTPEELVRQLYAHKLLEEYGYLKDQLKFEVPVVYAGREKITDKRIDIAVFSNKDKKKLDIVVECKRPEVKDENVTYDGEASTPKQQLQSYCRLTKTTNVGVITNGANLLKFYHREDSFDDALVIDQFPHRGGRFK